MLNRHILGAILLTALVAVGAKAGEVTISADGHLPLKHSDIDLPHAIAVRFDLSSIPSGATIDLAEITVSLDADTALGKNILVLAHGALSSWTPSEIPTLDNLVTCDSILSSNFSGTGDNQTAEINVTEIVRLWHAGTLENKGLYLSVDRNTENRGVALHSENGVPQAALKVYYSEY